MNKKLLLQASAVLSISLLCTHVAQAKQTLRVWFTNTDHNATALAFEKTHPDVDVKITIVPQNNLHQKLMLALRSRSKVMPDVLTLTDQWITKSVNQSYLLDLEKSDHINSFAEKNYYSYLLNEVKDKNGHIRALPVDSTIGAYYYKRSLARKILGSDDPKVVSEHLKDWDSYLKTAKLVKEKTHGKVRMLASADNLLLGTYYHTKEPIVIGNKINIKPLLNDFYHVFDQLNNDDNSANLKMWSPSMYKTYVDNSVFGYFLPAWAISQHLPKRAQGTEGDWALASPPSNFTYGAGMFLGVNALSKKHKLALEYVKFSTANQKFLRELITNTQYFSGNKIINSAMANEVSSAYIGGGQKPFIMLNKLSNELNLPQTRTTPYDQGFFGILFDKAVDYSADAKAINKDDFLNKIKVYIHSNYHNLK